jgi:hypothetical protein
MIATLVTRGAASLSNSSHLPAIEGSRALQQQTQTIPIVFTGGGDPAVRHPATGDNHVGHEAYQLCRIGTDTIWIAGREAKIDPQVAAFDPAELCERLL